MDNETLITANIFDLLGMQHLPEERKTLMLSRMERIVQKRVADHVASSLTTEQRKGLDALVEKDASAEEIDTFMKANVPGFDTMLAEELLRFKRETVENVTAVKQYLEETK